MHYAHFWCNGTWGGPLHMLHSKRSFYFATLHGYITSTCVSEEKKKYDISLILSSCNFVTFAKGCFIFTRNRYPPNIFPYFFFCFFEILDPTFGHISVFLLKCLVWVGINWNKSILECTRFIIWELYTSIHFIKDFIRIFICLRTYHLFLSWYNSIKKKKKVIIAETSLDRGRR